MNAPTTRETADHAELTRLADEMVGLLAPSQGERLLEYERHQLDVASRIQTLSRALLSEIAALRGDLTETRVAADLLVSSVRADLRQAERRRQSVRATQTESRCDELRGALEEMYLAYTEAFDDEECAMLARVRLALANQGADQSKTPAAS